MDVEIVFFGSNSPRMRPEKAIFDPRRPILLKFWNFGTLSGSWTWCTSFTWCTSWYSFDAENSAHAILDSPEISKTWKCARNGSPWLENQHKAMIFAAFFETELMAAAVSVKTMIFEQFWSFVIFWFFSIGESSIRCKTKAWHRTTQADRWIVTRSE